MTYVVLLDKSTTVPQGHKGKSRRGGKSFELSVTAPLVRHNQRTAASQRSVRIANWMGGKNLDFYFSETTNHHEGFAFCPSCKLFFPLRTNSPNCATGFASHLGFLLLNKEASSLSLGAFPRHSHGTIHRPHLPLSQSHRSTSPSTGASTSTSTTTSAQRRTRNWLSWCSLGSRKRALAAS